MGDPENKQIMWYANDGLKFWREFQTCHRSSLDRKNGDWSITAIAQKKNDERDKM